ncbi:hypothetical protein D3C78_1717300 [compost metagenome]
MAPQLTATKGPSDQAARSCSRRAMRSLPTPVSPWISALLRQSANISASASSARMGSETAISGCSRLGADRLNWSSVPNSSYSSLRKSAVVKDSGSVYEYSGG